MGVALPKDYVHEVFGVPNPTEDDEVYQKTKPSMVEDVNIDKTIDSPTEEVIKDEDVVDETGFGEWSAGLIDETENELRARVIPPSHFQSGSFRRIALDEAGGIFAIIGKLKNETNTTVQAYRFMKPNWTKEKAVAWLKKHKAPVGKSMASFIEYIEPLTISEITEEEKKNKAGRRFS
jgi:hypothetical protein